MQSHERKLTLLPDGPRAECRLESYVREYPQRSIQGVTIANTSPKWRS